MKKQITFFFHVASESLAAQSKPKINKQEQFIRNSPYDEKVSPNPDFSILSEDISEDILSSLRWLSHCPSRLNCPLSASATNADGDGNIQPGVLYRLTDVDILGRRPKLSKGFTQY